MYVQAQDNPANNIKGGAEEFVGPAAYTEQGFKNTVNTALNVRKTAIQNQTKSPEPCGNCTPDCSQFFGYLNCRLPSGTWLYECQAEERLPASRAPRALR
jgi:hypothetical protein